MRLATPLVGNVLILRTLAPEDVTTSYLGWLNDPEINRYLEVRFSPPKLIEQLKEFVASTNATDDSLILGIFLRSDQWHIGNIKLGPIDRHHSVADIGLLIGNKGEQGKGYASMAISLLSEYAFRSLHLAKLTAGCYADNQASTRAFLRAGYVIEGRRLSQWQVGDQRQDGILLGKVNPSSGGIATSPQENGR
jgi:RimJ/RimL family protein N-acetyltransferase